MPIDIESEELTTCEVCNSLPGMCVCPTCTGCDNRVESVCDNCEQCTDSCCECYSCAHCHNRVDSLCERCEQCTGCCECYHCSGCERMVEYICSNCDSCEDGCCDCHSCEDCGERVSEVCNRCHECDRCCSCSDNSENMLEGMLRFHSASRTQYVHNPSHRYISLEIEVSDGDAAEMHRVANQYSDAIVEDGSLGPISKTFATRSVLPSNFALHTRYATTGKVKESNSHPFAVRRTDLVIGMHNGIISNHAYLNRQYQRNCRVDSQHIFEHIADGLPLDDLEGYGTIVYKSGKDWYIGTFNGGELAVSRTHAGLFFASTHKALDSALLAAGLSDSARDVPTKDNTIYRLTSSGLKVAYTVNVGETFAKWDDGRTAKTSRHKGNSALLDTIDDGKEWEVFSRGSICAECGDILPLASKYTECDRCAANPDEWDIEVIPDGLSMMCGDCGQRIDSFQEVAISGQTTVCMDCLVLYDTYEDGEPK